MRRRDFRGAEELVVYRREAFFVLFWRAQEKLARHKSVS